MNEDAFWQLIDACTPTGPDPDSERLAAAPTEHLARSPVYVHAYERITGEEWNRATRYSYESYANAKGWAA
ncbi:hypothetical protein [Streptomyces chrestomyceticus]|uniref:hypothetical protein n=1 Tax=Streptomyces chrestomyceticus TaxID=68185 RepID=UPI0037A0A488